MRGYDNAPIGKGGAALFVTVIVIGLAIIFTGEKAKADDADFMDADTQRARLTEANGECRIAGALGADVQGCVSAYFCTTWNECDGENVKKPLAPTPWGVYRDSIGDGK